MNTTDSPLSNPPNVSFDRTCEIGRTRLILKYGEGFGWQFLASSLGLT